MYSRASQFIDSWRDHIRQGAAVAAALRARLDPDRPPHVGVLLQNTPFFSALLVAAGADGDRAGRPQPHPPRRGAASATSHHADCQVVLADSASAAVVGEIDHIDVDSPVWAAEVAAHHDAPVTARAAEPNDTFMLIFTSGTSGDPKAVICSHGKVAIAGVMMTERFGLGPDDICYVSMPLFHSNAVLVGWAVSLACRGSMVLRRKFSASQFLPDVRRYRATYANYVGKPLSYVLATPERPDDADNPLRAVYGNEGAPADVDRFAGRFGTFVVDGFGSTEGGVAIGRTPDTPPGALGPLPEGTEIVDVDTGEPCPAGVTGEIVNTDGPGPFRGLLQRSRCRCRAHARRRVPQRRPRLPRRKRLRVLRGAAGRLDARRRREPRRRAHRAGAAAPPRRDRGRGVRRYRPADVGDQVMAALLLADGAAFDVDAFREFLDEQPDLGPKQWPAFVRIATELPRTESFKVIKRQLAAQATDCADAVWPIRR